MRGAIPRFIATFCYFVLLSLAALGQTNPVPLVNQPLVPTTAAPGGAAFTLTVNGTGFVSGAVVNWNGTPLDTTFVSAFKLTAGVPATNIAVATTASITVTDPSPGGGSSNPVFFPVSVAASSLYFTNSQILTTDASPSSVAVGDFNRDGKLDLAVASNGTVSIFLGNGDGTFQPKVDYAALASPVGITTADFRGNGILDLAVFTPGEISVLLGNGDGTFQPQVEYPGYPGCMGECFDLVGGAILAADFNRDGKLDLAASFGYVEVAAESHNTAPPIVISVGYTSVFLGNGDGTFQPYINTSSAPGSVGIAAGDFNKDGKIDLAWALNPADDTEDNTAGVGLGKGDGTFQIGFSEDDQGMWGGNQPLVASADFNGDGNLDFVVCNGGNASVLLGNGDGTLQTPIVTGGGCDSLAVGDFHGNGFLDLATEAAVFTGNGTGEFPESGAVILPNGSGNQTVWVSAADFNGDGKMDVVIANTNNTIWVDLQSGSAALSPTSLSLSSYIGITSVPQNITLSNTAGAGLAISGIVASADFSQTNNCPVGGDLAPMSSCTIKVTFTPTAQGTVSGTLSITDDGPGSPQSVALTGTVSAVTIAPSSLNFVSYPATTTAPQSVSLSNPASEALAISGITASTNFAQTNNCPVGGSLPSGSSCTIKVTFTPTASGILPGTVNIADDGFDSPQAISLSGTVQDFAITTTSQTSVTVTPGQAANYAVSVSPVNGFNQAVQLSCSGAPAQTTCTVTPTSVTLDGSKAVAVDIAVVTTAATAALTQPYVGPPSGNELGTRSAALGVIALAVLASLIGWRSERRRRWIRRPAFLCLLALGLAIAGCGGGSSPGGGGGTTGTAAGTYNLTVTGTFKSGSTTLTHAVKLMLVVQ
jgi:hypothetical protein